MYKTPPGGEGGLLPAQGLYTHMSKLMEQSTAVNWHIYAKYPFVESCVFFCLFFLSLCPVGLSLLNQKTLKHGQTILASVS